MLCKNIYTGAISRKWQQTSFQIICFQTKHRCLQTRSGRFKKHQNHHRPGLRPDPTREFTALPKPLAGGEGASCPSPRTPPRLGSRASGLSRPPPPNPEHRSTPLFRGLVKVMSPIASHSPLNSLKTVRCRGLVPKDHQYEMPYGVSNGHVTDDVAWPRNVKLVTPICLESNISKTAGDAS